MKRSYLFFLMAAVSLFVGCKSTPAGLTESQAVGYKHSPAVLYSVSVNGNAKAYTYAKAREKASTALQLAGGFTFIDQSEVNRVRESAAEKAAKKAKRKEVFAVFTGEKSLLTALTDDEDSSLSRVEIFKALSKDKHVKAKYFVTVDVHAGVVKKKNAVKPAAKTIVKILDKDNEVEKSITAVASIPPIDMADLTDKSQITEKFPELIERSIQLAGENLNKKDGFFEINALKDDTLELVTSSDWGVSFATWD